MRKGVDLGVLGRVPVDPAEARQRVLAVDVHGARAADALAARAAECQRRVDLVLDLNQGVEHLHATRHVVLNDSLWDSSYGREGGGMMSTPRGK